ncbi:accessory gene regulator B family protein [Paenibacillus sp. P25]|nr:accessory gene regulator B family protein [Paenibacillus sp. P25]
MNLIDRSASYLTQAIRNNNPNAGSETALKYSLILLINTGSAILISLMLSSITGRATYALLSVSGFLILRYFSGGFTFHLRYLAVFFQA